MNDREQMFEILKMLAALLGGIVFLGYCVVSVIRSIEERRLGPAGETGLETDCETKSDAEKTLAESELDGQESSSAQPNSDARLNQ